MGISWNILLFGRYLLLLWARVPIWARACGPRNGVVDLLHGEHQHLARSTGTGRACKEFWQWQGPHSCVS
eukprot:g27059.t1